MLKAQLSLFGSKRFLPLFATQFLGALNDNVFKNALMILVAFRLAEEAGLNGQVLVTVAAGIFILPFFLFSATAGQLADRFEKSLLIRWIKTSEIVVMGLGALSLWMGSPGFMLGVLFAMGAQSAFFGPVKYSILPDHLSEEELIGGNALIEAGTFLAILIGTIAGGLLILTDFGTTVVSGVVVLLAIAGWATSLAIPKTPIADPSLRIEPNFAAETARIVGRARENRSVFLSILGISWFWLVGATFLAQFPAFTKDVLAADETVVTLFLTVFSIGIGVGSLICNRLVKGEITAKYVPFGILGMTVFVVDLYMATSGLSNDGSTLVGAAAFLSAPENWRILADLLGIAICGGIFIVPLYAIMQSRAAEAERSRVVAANNILNAGFMVIGSLAATAMLALDVTVPGVFLIIGIANAFVALYICKLLPDELLRTFFKIVLKFFYRVEVKGVENLNDLGDRGVIVANHVSLLDGLLLAVFLPGKFTFAIDTFIAQRWWVRPFLGIINAFPIDPTNPMAAKSLIKEVRSGKRCVIFPEGRLTVTGALMKVNEGPGMIADKADAPLVPIRIDGAQYTPFSRLKGTVRLRWFPKITLTILPVRRFQVPEGASARQRRRLAAIKLYDVMSEMIFETQDRDRTLFSAMIEARAIHGGSHKIAEDTDRKPVSYDRLILGSRILGKKLTAVTAMRENVGVLLPNSVGLVTVFFALQAFGRVPAMLNFSTGERNMRAAVETAGIKTILTSRRFVQLAKLDTIIAALEETAQVVYLEDIRKGVSTLDKLLAVVTRPFAGLLHNRLRIVKEAPAVVLFTSGSEGTPKGVVLSHQNLLANCHQLSSRIDFSARDTVFNALPMFHSFGLTGGALLPILSGVQTFLYPSPLHYRIVAALVYDTNATIMFGTDTFLSGYARVAHAYDFYSLRIVFAGAEKLKEETRRVWADRFGVRVLEGYGATETAPVLAANTPMHCKPGTVGRLMPGISHRLEPVPGIDEGGRLIVTGPNVMLGYLMADDPGVLKPVEGATYDTGDIVTIDSEGYVSIRGRAKRFAKIAGEMVSLSAVEEMAATLWPGAPSAAVALPDPRKGEQVLLFTEQPDADRTALLTQAKATGVPELMVPKLVQSIEKLPILGTGKVDYPALTSMAEQTFAKQA